MVTLTAQGRMRHDQRQQALAEALDTTLARYDASALRSAAEILDCLGLIYDRL